MRLNALLGAQPARLMSAKLRRRRRSPDDVGFAVRCDWPLSRAGVVHDFSRFATSQQRARRRAEATARFWRPGSMRPLAVTVVPIVRGEFAAHPPACTSLTCPTTAVLYGLAAGASAGVPG
ncbi:hypothetical protein [Dactylosporangium darangshiense]|uniref:hypothetical protein n=1 Tax=Dactylosporangium darangshiense TaxID=579108 RepID=UPI0036336C77